MKDEYNDYGRRPFIVILTIGTILMYLMNNKNPFIVVPIMLIVVTLIVEIILSRHYKLKHKGE